MKLSRLIECDRDVDITGISVDSRTVEKGNLFLCIAGERHDGHDFVKEAISRGAVAVVTERRVGVEGEIVVSSTRKAASQVFSRWYNDPQKRLRVFGVTGTNGKTSTVAILDAIYRECGYNTGVMGTIGSRWNNTFRSSDNTTAPPEVLFPVLNEMVISGVETLFMEVSSHALCLDRVSEIFFDYGVYTNLTRDHLDFHGTMDAYAAAKEKLFFQTRVGVFNCDDAYSYIASQRCLCAPVRFGSRVGSELRLVQVFKQDLEGSFFSVDYQGNQYLFSSPLAGEFNLYNLLAAITVAMHDGIDYSVIAKAVSAFRGAKGRMEKIYEGLFTVFIDYAHTPDALTRVLKTLASENPKRLRVVFGCGGERDKGKRPIMGRVAQELANDVIVTADNSRGEALDSILDDIVSGMSQTQDEISFKVIRDRRKALEYVIQTALPGDVILVAGKGHEEYEIDCSGRHSFSERSVLLSHLKTCGFL